MDNSVLIHVDWLLMAAQGGCSEAQRYASRSTDSTLYKNCNPKQRESVRSCNQPRTVNMYQYAIFPFAIHQQPLEDLPVEMAAAVLR